MESASTWEACGLLGKLLEYPHEPVSGRAEAAVRLVASGNPSAAALLREFAAKTGQMPLGKLQELYTSTFDLQPTCCLYTGYHLFGESQKRSLLMIGLQEEYKRRGFAVEGELPDHLAIVLSFLSVADDPELRQSLVGECVVPTLGKVERSIAGSGNPYHHVARALLEILGATVDLSSLVSADGLSTVTGS